MAQTEISPRVQHILEDLERQLNTPGLMDANLAELRAQVAAYEKRYGMTAVEAHEAIDRGDLEEDLDVCDWLLDDRLLRDIEAGEP